jgi:Bacterial type II/III secretion system short domain
MKRVLMILLAVLFTTGVVFADPAEGAKALSVKTFQFKFKNADRAAVVIKSLLSADGSMSIQPSANSLVVTDHPENLKAVSAAINEFDSAPRTVKLSVRLVAASKSEIAVKPVEELRDIARSFAMLGYNSLESIGSANIDSHEGELGTIELGGGYRADFRFGEYDPTSDSVRLEDFRISKLQGDQLSQIYKTTLNLKVGQTTIVSAKRPQGQRALSIAFVARR